MNMLFLMNKTKDQISWVSSHDLYWENKMYERKRSISGYFVVLAWNCLASTLNYIVMQIWKSNRVKRAITYKLDYSASLKPQQN